MLAIPVICLIVLAVLALYEITSEVWVNLWPSGLLFNDLMHETVRASASLVLSVLVREWNMLGIRCVSL